MGKYRNSILSNQRINQAIPTIPQLPNVKPVGQVASIWDQYLKNSINIPAPEAPLLRGKINPSTIPTPQLQNQSQINIPQKQFQSYSPEEITNMNKSDGILDQINQFWNGKYDKYGNKYGGKGDLITTAGNGLLNGLNIWNAYNTNKIAQDQYDLAKKEYEYNKENNAKMTNRQLERQDVFDMQMRGDSRDEALKKVRDKEYRKKNYYIG